MKTNILLLVAIMLVATFSSAQTTIDFGQITDVQASLTSHGGSWKMKDLHCNSVAAGLGNNVLTGDDKLCDTAGLDANSSVILPKLGYWTENPDGNTVNTSDTCKPPLGAIGRWCFAENTTHFESNNNAGNVTFFQVGSNFTSVKMRVDGIWHFDMQPEFHRDPTAAELIGEGCLVVYDTNDNLFQNCVGKDSTGNLFSSESKENGKYYPNTKKVRPTNVFNLSSATPADQQKYGINFNGWLRTDISVTGGHTTYTSYYSLDGTNWNQIYQRTSAATSIPDTVAVLAGFANSSNPPGFLVSTITVQ